MGADSVLHVCLPLRSYGALPSSRAPSFPKTKILFRSFFGKPRRSVGSHSRRGGNRSSQLVPTTSRGSPPLARAFGPRPSKSLRGAVHFAPNQGHRASPIHVICHLAERPTLDRFVPFTWRCRELHKSASLSSPHPPAKVTATASGLPYYRSSKFSVHSQRSFIPVEHFSCFSGVATGLPLQPVPYAV